MAPDFPFSLDREGHEKCGVLLAAAGMQFVEQRREGLSPDSVTVYGELISPHGTFRCELCSSPRHYFFVITIRGHGKAASLVVEDVERAFDGHLISKHERPVA
jgi:hypothetical protein